MSVLILQRIDEGLQAVDLDFQGELHEFTEFTGRESPVDEPKQILFWQVDQWCVPEPAEWHGPVGDPDEIFLFETLILTFIRHRVECTCKACFNPEIPPDFTVGLLAGNSLNFPRIFYVFVVALAIQMLLLVPPPAVAQTVSQGLADLRTWDFRKPVRLSGEYEFYWEQLLLPRELLLNPNLQPDYMGVPDTWGGKTISVGELPETGFATYRVNVLLPSIEAYALKIPDIGTTYELFVDGKSLAKVGVPGSSMESTTPRYYPTTVSFVPETRRVEIVVHVANFHYRMGGIWLPIVLGTPQQIEDITENQRALDLLLFGAIVIIGLYNLALFGLRREDPSSLYLGLLCLLLSTRLLAVGDRYLTRISDLPFEWFVRIEYLSWLLAISAFAGFMRAVIPNEFNRFVAYAMHGIVGVGSLIILLTGLEFFTYLVPVFQVFTVACLIAGSISFGLAIARRREGALLLTLAYAVLFYSVINDILLNAGIIDTFLMLDIGLLVFIFFQSMLISYRFTNSFKLVENQRASLEAINLRLRTQEKLRQQLEDESEQMQRRMSASEKMETIETLIGGIKERITEFLAAAGNQPPARVIRDFLIIAVGDSDEKSKVDLNRVIEAGAGDAKTNLQKDLPPVSCNPEHAARLVSALVEFFQIHNVVDLAIETHLEPASDTSMFFDELDSGDYVVLSIGGTGQALVELDVEHLFDPAQSLMLHEAHDTGFGLPVVRSITRSMGGGIDLAFLDKGGFRIELYLPC